MEWRARVVCSLTYVGVDIKCATEPISTCWLRGKNRNVASNYVESSGAVLLNDYSFGAKQAKCH